MPKEIASSQSPAEIAGQAAQLAEVPALSIQLAPMVPVPEPLPQAGGSYVRTESGALQRVEHTGDAPSSLVVEPSEQTEGL